MTRAGRPRELPLAAMPILFALQQTIEGLLWLDLPVAPEGPIATDLGFLFLFFAEVFWPVYVPAAVLLIEPGPKRRRIMLLCLAAGAGVAAGLLWRLLAGPQGAQIQSAQIRDGHIVYATDEEFSAAIALAYLAATGLPFMLSSQRAVLALGTIVIAGGAIAYAFYGEAFVSVWCFFAATASLVILGHVERARRQRLRLAGA